MIGLYTPEYQPTGKEIAVFNTAKGVIRVQLLGDIVPISVGNFVELAQKGFYDHTKVSRVKPRMVLEGGCPYTRSMTSEQIAIGARGPEGAPGTGGPGYRIKDEWNLNPDNGHDLGVLATYRSPLPDSAGSMFVFPLGPQHNLDRERTVFGRVIEGIDVIEALEVGDEFESIVIENAAE